MTDYTRLLAVGTARRADVMVPSDEPFAVAAPWLLEVLDEETGSVSAGLSIVRVDGSQVDLALSPRDQALLDGEIVRFVRAEDAPAPPEVSDVTTAVADAFARRPLPWTAAARHAAAAVGVTALIALVALGGFPGLDPDARWGVLSGIALLAAGVAAALRPLSARAAGARFAALMLVSVGLGAAIAAGLIGVIFFPSPGQEWWRLAAAGAAIWVVLGLGMGVGLASRGALAASVVALVPAGALALCAVAGATAAVTWGVVGVIAVAMLGLVPWYVVSLSGLAGLDDRVAASDRPPTEGTGRVIRAAYDVSSWTTVALALPLAGAGVVLAASQNAWAGWLALALALVAALRTRVSPGRVESIALWAAALTVVVVVSVAWVDPVWQPWVLIGLAALIAVGAVAQPADHVRARLRRFGNLIEWLAVVALVPLLLGVYDLYADLLGTFRA